MSADEKDLHEKNAEAVNSSLTKTEGDGKKRWYVVQAYSGYEKRVKTQIEEKIKLEGLEQYFGKILVPTEEVVEMKAGQKRKSERKFFPGYVLIQMEMDEAAWQLVRRIPRVSGFVGGTSERPMPISNTEAERILVCLMVLLQTSRVWLKKLTMKSREFTLRCLFLDAQPLLN
jgi:transcriptional antiterminator NusG